ncbi:hypothetical protein CMEL01_15941, partial [Colletotrichum melonis]
VSCSHFKLKQSSLITYLDPNRLLITTAGELIKDHWEPNRPPSRSSGMDSRPDLRAHGYPLPSPAKSQIHRQRLELWRHLRPLKYRIMDGMVVISKSSRSSKPGQPRSVSRPAFVASGFRCLFPAPRIAPRVLYRAVVASFTSTFCFSSAILLGNPCTIPG